MQPNWFESYIGWKMGVDIDSKTKKLKLYQGITREEQEEKRRLADQKARFFDSLRTSVSVPELKTLKQFKK